MHLIKILLQILVTKTSVLKTILLEKRILSSAQEVLV